MSDLLQLIARMRSAFEIFAQELDTHLEVFLAVSAELEEEDPQSVFTERAKTLEQRFHVIKGGSGFLQLKIIAELATAGEAWFKGGIPTSDPATDELRQQFQALVVQLSKEREALHKLLAEASNSP